LSADLAQTPTSNYQGDIGSRIGQESFQNNGKTLTGPEIGFKYFETLLGGAGGACYPKRNQHLPGREGRIEMKKRNSSERNFIGRVGASAAAATVLGNKGFPACFSAALLALVCNN
jgi:hypothetical protein